MLSDLVILSNQFLKLATEIDLRQRLEMLSGWDSVTDESIPRIFFQELKSKPGEHKDKIRATKLVYEIKKLLSEWVSKALGGFKAPNRLIILPRIYDPEIENIFSLSEELRPLIKSYGGSKIFTDEYLKKFFRALNIVLLLSKQISEGGEIDLKLYSELIYMNHSEMIKSLKDKMENKILKNKEHLSSYVEMAENGCLYLVEDLIDQMDEKTLSKFVKNNNLDKIRSSALDYLRDLTEDNGEFEICRSKFVTYLSKIFKLPEEDVIDVPNYNRFFDNLENFYANSSSFRKTKQVFKQLISDLNAGGKISVYLLDDAEDRY